MNVDFYITLKSYAGIFTKKKRLPATGSSYEQVHWLLERARRRGHLHVSRDWTVDESHLLMTRLSRIRGRWRLAPQADHAHQWEWRLGRHV